MQAYLVEIQLMGVTHKEFVVTAPDDFAARNVGEFYAAHRGIHGATVIVTPLANFEGL